MTGMFPGSGVPAADAKNSIADPDTQNCDELWYSTSRCQPRFDPAAANAVLAELINLINKGEVSYDCEFLNQVEMATRYLIQRGVPRGGRMAVGPAAYTLALDPPLTRYNDYLTLSVVPNVDNTGAATVDVNGKGAVPILRNDGTPTVKGDLRADRPVILICLNSKFYVPHFLPSQIPILQQAALDYWVRPDGSDVTGDGSANTPDKAFRTIRGAWQAAAARYFVSPIFPLNIRLGVAGDYEGAVLGPYGGPVNIIGNDTNRTLYRIKQIVGNDTFKINLYAAGINLYVNGVTFPVESAGSVATAAVVSDNSQVGASNCEYEIRANLPNCTVIQLVAGGVFTMDNGHKIYGIAGNNQVAYVIGASTGSLFWGGSYSSPGNLLVQGLAVVTATLTASDLSTIRLTMMNITQAGVTGKMYTVSTNSTLNRDGETVPGTIAGTADTGGQVS